MARLVDVLKDESFVKELIAMETPEAALEAFKAKGVEISIAEVKAIGAELAGIEAELSEDALSSVAGGGAIKEAYEDIIYIRNQIPNDKVREWVTSW